jgi:arylsulfatase A-like enzyme
MEKGRKRMRRTVLVLASVALAVLCFWSITDSPPPAAQTTPTKPNIVFILTDDMRKDDLAYMPNTRNLIASQGMTFNNAYVPLASCCPSRASILRGQYVHNHKVWFSDVHIGGYQAWATQGHESDNLATHLQAGGYSTGLFGKYMNGYSKNTGKPPGWTDWFAMNGGEGYFNYSVNDNGVTKKFGSTASDYFMDVINTESQQFIQNSVTAGKPFFLYVSPKLPHLPSTPAPRYVNAFNGEPAPRLPSYNEENVSDKPPWISSLPKISSTEAAAIQQRHEKRIESLQAADEAVKDIVDKLSATGQLSNTYIVFTSDNGWQHGEHRIPRNKDRPYEESSNMPLLVRGPGVATGSSDKLVTFPDFMPTFLELGGIDQSRWPSYIDGRSLVPVLNGTASSWRTAVLLEERDEGSPERNYFAIRTASGVKYIEYASGFKEYYNLNSDPNEMTSTPGSASASLVDRLQRLKTCAADTCRSIENEGLETPPPPPPSAQTATFPITASLDDQFVAKNSSGYPPSNAAFYNSWEHTVWAERSLHPGGNYEIVNGLLRFNTSNLPDDATITGARLQVDIVFMESANGLSLTGDWFNWDGSNAEADYSAMAQTGAIAPIEIGYFVSGPKSFDLLNASTNISKTGTSSLRLHIDGGPPTGMNYVKLASWNHDTAAEPKLVVTY